MNSFVQLGLIRLVTSYSYNPDGSLYSALTALVRPEKAMQEGQLTVGTASSGAVNLAEYRYDAFGEAVAA